MKIEMIAAYYPWLAHFLVKSACEMSKRVLSSGYPFPLCYRSQTDGWSLCPDGFSHRFPERGRMTERARKPMR